jgi:hypothetical protein
VRWQRLAYYRDREFEYPFLQRRVQRTPKLSSAAAPGLAAVLRSPLRLEALRLNI